MTERLNFEELQIGNTGYAVWYTCGIEEHDGDAGEFVWIELEDVHAFDENGDETIVLLADVAVIEERLVQLTSELFGIEY